MEFLVLDFDGHSNKVYLETVHLADFYPKVSISYSFSCHWTFVKNNWLRIFIDPLQINIRNEFRKFCTNYFNYFPALIWKLVQMSRYNHFWKSNEVNFMKYIITWYLLNIYSRRNIPSCYEYLIEILVLFVIFWHETTFSYSAFCRSLNHADLRQCRPWECDYVA